MSKPLPDHASATAGDVRADQIREVAAMLGWSDGAVAADADTLKSVLGAARIGGLLPGVHWCCANTDGSIAHLEVPLGAASTWIPLDVTGFLRDNWEPAPAMDAVRRAVEYIADQISNAAEVSHGTGGWR